MKKAANDGDPVPSFVVLLVVFEGELLGRRRSRR
jgi:hypothetical protein